MPFRLGFFRFRLLITIDNGKNMEKITLHRFFAGEASDAEKRQIKSWLEEDDKHQQQLLDERAFFDAMLLADDRQAAYLRRSVAYRTLRYVGRYSVQWVAVFAIAFLSAYFWMTGHYEKQEEAVNVVSVLQGQRANLTLADGTRVCLNAGSTLSYPAAFAGEIRKVELDGEAYFEVSKSKKKPFVVHTQMCDVTVLGTKFNVDAYSDKNTFSAALMEGKIKVDNNYSPTDIIYLSPSQQVSLKNGKLDVAPIVDYDIYRWREGLICFTDVNFVELMKRIEKYYGVDMEVENTGLARHVFSGKFRISDGIDNLLLVLQKDVYFDFERSEDGNTIYIR